MDEQKKKWREQMKDAPIKSCGRLDGATYLCSEVTVGRVESDVVRYVYFEDGREVICVGELADFVAFRAADYFDAIEDAVTAERDRIAREIEALHKENSELRGEVGELRSEFDRIVESVAQLPSYDKETTGGWQPIDEMVEQERMVNPETGEEWFAGEWLRRDDVLRVVKGEA